MNSLPGVKSNMRKVISSFLILTLVLLTNANCQKLNAANPETPEVKNEENNKVNEAEIKTESKEPEIIADKPEEDEISSTVWNESLGLKDFYVSPTTIQVNANKNLKNYNEHLETQYKEHSDTFSVAIEYGLFSIDRGDIEKADQIFTKAVNDFKGNPTPPIYKAWVDALKGNYKSAKDVWYKTLKEKVAGGYNNLFWLPSDADAVIGLYCIENYLPESEKEEVKTLVDDISKHLGAHPKVKAILISKDLQSGRLKLAGTKLASTLAKNPEEPIIIGLLGISQLITGHNNEALKLLDKSNELYPFSPTVNLMRARALFALDEKKESKLAYKKAIELDASLETKNVKKDYLLKSNSYISSSEANTEAKQ